MSFPYNLPILLLVSMASQNNFLDVVVADVVVASVAGLAARFVPLCMFYVA